MRLSTVIQDGQDVVGVVKGNDWFSLGTGLRAALVQGVDLFARAATAIRDSRGVPLENWCKHRWFPIPSASFALA